MIKLVLTFSKTFLLEALYFKHYFINKPEIYIHFLSFIGLQNTESDWVDN